MTKKPIFDINYSDTCSLYHCECGNKIKVRHDAGTLNNNDAPNYCSNCGCKFDWVADSEEKCSEIPERGNMKYKKKPVVIEAFQYDGDLKGADGNYYVPDWAVKAFEKGIMHYGALHPDEPQIELFIDTLEGTHHVSVGDYVIRGIKGELYPCKPDIFKKTYERVGEPLASATKANGWIPVTECLPEEHDSIFANLQGTDKWRPGMFKKASNDVIVTIRLPAGQIVRDISCTKDGAWTVKWMPGEKVIAWMPLPEPYKEENR